MRRRNLLVATLLVLSCALTLPGTSRVGAGQVNRDIIRNAPLRSDAGEWAGTWYYKSRGLNIVFWFRDNGGVPQLRVQTVNKDRGESFQTDWDTRAEYQHRGRTGTFEIQFTVRDENTIEGEWIWQLGHEGQPIRVDRGQVTMYRFSDGRDLVVMFPDLERAHLRSDGSEEARVSTAQIWTMRKASRREALWAELPF